MPFKKGIKPPGSGRKKGVPNKLTACSRAAMMEAFDKLGGVDALLGWANENTTDFYKLWGKTIPTAIAGDKENPLEIKVIEIKFIGPDDK